jgi:hypothetical protein
MMRIGGLALVILLWGCGDDDGSGPDESQLDGTWIGSFTNSAFPTQEFEAVLELSQADDEVSGTLTTTLDLSATVSGTVTGDQLELTFSFTDVCSGSATSTAELVDETIPPSLEGTYSSDDCLDGTSGEYSLIKEE